MGKIIFWLVVFFVVLLMLRLVNVASSRSRSRPTGKRKTVEPAMTQCVDCGIYLPSADATTSARGPLCGDPQCVARRNDT